MNPHLTGYLILILYVDIQNLNCESKKNELTLAALIKQGISTVEPIMESLIQLVFASDGRTPFPSRPGPTGPTAHGPDPGVWRGCRGSSCCPRPRQPPAVELFGESNMAIENP